MTDNEKVVKSEGRGRWSYYSESRRRQVSSVILIFLLILGLIALIIWLVYRPHNPHFMVVAAAIYNLNTTSPTTVAATMQFTVFARNPNKRTSIHYDDLSTYVTYHNQQLTVGVMLPPFSHETKSTVALSPVLGGGMVPVSMDVANALMTDQANGIIGLKLIIEGRVRYKAGAIKTGHQDMVVKCDTVIGLKEGNGGQVPLLGYKDCDVDI
ncbi:hypothetical protein ACHQM5_027699 [Ranunculus cassubicifolius]